MSPVSSSLVTSAGGLLAEALRGFPLYTKPKKKDTDDLPLGATFKTTTSMTPKVSKVKDEVNIELDNAGRVKSGKVDFALFIKSKGKVKKQIYWMLWNTSNHVFVYHYIFRKGSWCVLKQGGNQPINKF